ncbi:M24 family metallopeptidase [candidate division WOR-3 bacterium]|nr:M24 family metallopeptidase [candidate division WOR-3 bacterium]
MNERIEKIHEYLKQKNIGCLLIDSPFDILYLLHINQSFNFIELNFLLLITHKKIFLISNPLTLALIKKYLPDVVEIIESETTPFVKHHFRYIQEIKKLIDMEKIEKIGLTSLQYIDVSKHCERVENPIPYLAAIKTDKEIEFIRKSASVLKKVYKEIKEEIGKGCSEIELRNSIDIKLHQEGSERRAFPTKVAFGKKTANIYPVSTMDRLKENDIVLIDMGGVYKGYISEMARTIFHGEPDAKQKEIYNIVFSAYEKMKEFIKPGIVASAADKVVRGYFEEMGHEQFFFTPLGESTGLVKGGISLAPNNQEVLKTGMVFTVEPALYLPDWGGVKIKETILITDDGMDELTGGPEQNE